MKFSDHQNTTNLENKDHYSNLNLSNTPPTEKLIKIWGYALIWTERKYNNL